MNALAEPIEIDVARKNWWNLRAAFALHGHGLERLPGGRFRITVDADSSLIVCSLDDVAAFATRAGIRG